MLAIKWITLRGETITHEAVSVRTMPWGLGTDEDAVSPGEYLHDKVKLVEYERADGVRCTIDTGTVYVMNGSGKTIDTHYLGDPYTRVPAARNEPLEVDRENFLSGA